MVAEHDQLDPLLRAVDEALASEPAGLGGRARKLAATLNHHLSHEEERALPLIQSVLTPADWRDFINDIRRRQGIKGARLIRCSFRQRHSGLSGTS